MMRTGSLFVLAAAALALRPCAASDAARNSSEAMNAAAYSAEALVSEGVRIAFVGNSITLHQPLPEIGWTNSWGMAASAAEKDYVHLVADGIAAKTGRRPSVMVRNLATFERGYRTVDAGSLLADVVAFRPEYVVVALGENVPDLATEEDGYVRYAAKSASVEGKKVRIEGRTKFAPEFGVPAALDSAPLAALALGKEGTVQTLYG